MDNQTLIRLHLEKREQWVELGAGKRVKVRRPNVAEMAGFRRDKLTEETAPEKFLRCAVGWDGFTEADILGASVGSDAVVPWSLDLWLVIALDREQWILGVISTLDAAMKDYFAKEKDIEKN